MDEALLPFSFPLLIYYHQHTWKWNTNLVKAMAQSITGHHFVKTKNYWQDTLTTSNKNSEATARLKKSGQKSSRYRRKSLDRETW